MFEDQASPIFTVPSKRGGKELSCFSSGTSSSAMAMITVAPRKRKLFELLNDKKKVRKFVLLGESRVGKTWTAREISNLARKRGSIDIGLWVFLNREYDDRDTLCDSIEHQLSLLSTTGESEVEDENEELKEENQRRESQNCN